MVAQVESGQVTGQRVRYTGKGVALGEVVEVAGYVCAFLWGELGGKVVIEADDGRIFFANPSEVRVVR